jgi:pimeloyl-ACP methyl ester carboxylesterase
MFVRNFSYDGIIGAIAYYNALRDMENGSYVKLEAPVFCVTGNRDPLTPNYQTKYKDWFKFARRVGLVVINNVGHYLLRDTPEDVARLLHRIGAEDYAGVTDDEGRPTGVFTRLRAVFARH